MPKVVALGGGSGLSVTLTALRRYADDITAIVSVADDGGSSGRLRKTLGIPAPGDLRRCLVALSDPSSVWAQTFELRFTDGDLDGHPLGNLVIAGLAAATGDFTAALEEAGRMLGTVGKVLPATTEPVVLVAEADSGAVAGEVAVAHAGRISAVGLVPREVHSPAAAIDAITNCRRSRLMNSLMIRTPSTCGHARCRSRPARRPSARSPRRGKGPVQGCRLRS